MVISVWDSDGPLTKGDFLGQVVISSNTLFAPPGKFLKFYIMIMNSRANNHDQSLLLLTSVTIEIPLPSKSSIRCYRGDYDVGSYRN